MRYVSHTMADDNLISALTRKFAKLTGELDHAERRAARLRKDIAAIEATIRVFREDWQADTVAPVRPKRPSRWGGRGVCLRLSLDALRSATEPLTAREIALRVLAARGVEMPDARALWAAAGSVSGALNRRVGQGVVVIEGYPKRWSLDGVMAQGGLVD
jgi:hypothetical protein